MNKFQEFFRMCLVVLPILAVILAVILGGVYFIFVLPHKLQSEYYSKQGIQISTFQCFMGVKPVERNIIIKEKQ
jgi:hypothetical protein